MSFDKTLGVHVRGKTDLIVAKEQSGWKKLTALDLSKGAVLNLGGHIGLFERYMLLHSNAAKFITVEPDPLNIKFLRENLKILKANCELVEAACVHPAGTGKAVLYLGNKTDRCNSSLTRFRGRRPITVRTVPWVSLLRKKPVAVKIDIESSEYLLDYTLIPDSVRGVGFEFHFYKPHHPEQMERVNRELLGLGFVAAKPPKVNTFHRSCLAIYIRN